MTSESHHALQTRPSSGLQPGSGAARGCRGRGPRGVLVLSQALSWTLAAGSSMYLHRVLLACVASLCPWPQQAGGQEATTGMEIIPRGKKMQRLG